MLLSMMRLYLLSALFLFVYSTSSATCNGEPYDEIFSFGIPAEITFGETTYVIGGASIEGVSGLPSGLSYDCISCSAGPGGELAIRISGTPDDTPGEYVLNISASADVNGANVGISLPDPAFPESIVSIEIEDCGNSSCALEVSASGTNASCFDAQDGSASVSYSGAVGAVSIEWSDGSDGGSISNLSPGQYSVQVTDSEGCSASASISIGAPSELKIDVVFATISTPEDGEILVAPRGGSSPYSYSWSNGATTGYIGDLSPGTYLVIVTDDNGCTASRLVNLELEGSCTLSLETTQSDITCAGADDGFASISVLGSTNYNILWSNGSTSSTISNLSAGVYSVTVEAIDGCTASQEIIIAEPDPLEITEATITSPSCGAEDTGSISLSVSGGTAPYFFFWSDGTQSSSIEQLGAGSYEVSIGDSNGCVLVESYEIIASAASTVACDAITANYIGDGTMLSYQLSIVDADLNGVWQAESEAVDSTLQLGDSTTIAYIFPTEGIYTVSYSFEEESGCEVVCELTLEVFLDDNGSEACELIDAQYVGNWGAVRYEFTIGDTMLVGKWTATFSDGQIIGMGRTNTVAYTFPEEDDYNVCFTYKDEQGNTIECCRTFFLSLPANSSLGNNAKLIRDLTAMPNPFQDYISLQFEADHASRGEIEIWSLDGTLMYQSQQRFEQGFNQVNIQALFPAGLYFLKVKSENWVATKQLVVAK